MADALDSGSSGSNPVRVQVPFSAFIIFIEKPKTPVFSAFFFFQKLKMGQKWGNPFHSVFSVLNRKSMNLVYDSIKRRVDAASLAVGKEYTFDQDCYVYFGAAFTATIGYCRVYVTNENDEIVHYVQINPAPTAGNAQTTGEYFAKKGWKIKIGSYGSLYNNVISYSLVY